MQQYAATAVGLEGVVVKGLASRYEPGRRGWLKVRVRHTAKALVGAVTGSLDVPERLVLGYYADTGTLTVAGSTSPLPPRQRKTVAALLWPPAGDHPWPTEMPTGRLGHYSRDRVTVQLVDPTLVVEVSADNAYEHGRAGLTVADEVEVAKQFTAFGLTANQIARRTRTKKAHVEQIVRRRSVRARREGDRPLRPDARPSSDTRGL
jgi:ATP-dependent DNA ligase